MLTYKLTDLAGGPLTTFIQNLGGEVTIQGSESRTAKLTLSIYDPKVTHIKPLATRLKVYYYDSLVFNGVVLTPFWKSGSRSVEVNAHDQSIWWKRNYHRYGDYPVKVGYPFNGTGIFFLSLSAWPLEHQLARGVKHPGIIRGSDTSKNYIWQASTNKFVESAVAGPLPAWAATFSSVTSNDSEKVFADGDGMWSRVNRGVEVHESIKSTLSIQGAPEWELRPIEGTGLSGNVVGLDYANELNVFARQGTDKTGTVIFRRGFGKENLDDFEWSPDGNAVRNYAVANFPGGERNAFDPNSRALSHSEASWLEIGIYQEWYSTRQLDSKPVLQSKANAFVTAYKGVPDYFTIKPKWDSFRYLEHFGVGDTIRAICKDGYMICDLTGRIAQVVLSSSGGSSPAEVALDCVPTVLDAANLEGDERG